MILHFFIVRCRHCGVYRVYSTKNQFIRQGIQIKCFSCNKGTIPNSKKVVGYSVDVKGPIYNAIKAGDICAALNARGKVL